MSNIGGKFGLLFLAGFFVFGLGGVALAQQGHGHGGRDMPAHGSTPTHGSGSHSMSMKDRPVQSVSVDGFKISLDIMDMSMHTSMQKMKGNPPPHGYDQSKSHAIMVMIQDTASKEIITDAQVTCTILSPGGEKEAGKLQWSGDHYGRGFEPKEKGAYQVHLKIESGGMGRETNFTYNPKG
jgi:hypothetical protein